LRNNSNDVSLAEGRKKKDGRWRAGRCNVTSPTQILQAEDDSLFEDGKYAERDFGIK
jgi:hypothetical protein